MKKTAAILTLGCRVNQYESNALKAKLQDVGFEIRSADSVCDVYIINTCTVTAEADRKARNIIRRCRRRSPDAHIIVCGCYAQVSADEVAEIDGVSYVCGTKNKTSVITAALKLTQGEKQDTVNVVHPDSLPYEDLTDPQTGRTRAYIKIEDGCGNKCSYCVIHTARGNICSRSISDIVNEAQRIADAGFTEIVCTGIETTAFGKDTGETLPELIKALSDISGIRRLRLGSVDPSYLRADVCEQLFDGTKLMPHLHLSVQSGSDRILSLMRRPYNSTILRRNMDRLLQIRPGIRFSGDFIVGFPTETDEEFADSLSVLADYPFVHAHVFSYSKRKGTEASQMSGQIPEHIKAERYARFTALEQEKNKLRADELIKNNVSAEVLFESVKNGMIYGHAEDFTECAVRADAIRSGQYGKMIFTGYSDGVMTGELI